MTNGRVYRRALRLRMYSCRHITALNNTALVHGAKHATNTSRVRKHFGSRYPKTRHLTPRYLAAWKITRLRGNKDVLSSTIRFHFIRIQRIETIRQSAPVPIHFDRRMSSLRTRLQEIVHLTNGYRLPSDIARFHP